MAATHPRDDFAHALDGGDDPHASASRWRHQESSAFLQHAAPRDPTKKESSKALADFFNSSRIDPPHNASGATSPKHAPIAVAGHNGIPEVAPQDGILQVVCGPLLNYRRMEHNTWFGSVLIVTSGGGRYERPPPVLLMKTGPAGINASGSAGTQTEEPYGQVNGVDYSSFKDPTSNPDDVGLKDTGVPAVKLYSDPNVTFWRFDLQIAMQETEVKVNYIIPGLSFKSKTKNDKQSFYIPAIRDSMRIMFHSCNGFSVGTDEDAYSGPCLWNDVQRVHKVTPFHVMLGGGDQIYNDGIRVNGPLRKWTDISIPAKRKDHPFPEELRKECDEYYINNYIRWYSTEPFASANGQIPQLNLWDDHDIIDGFGSYTHDFMTCPVFRGIGGVANKYYLLFQHHLAPPPTSFTTSPDRLGRGHNPFRSRPNTAATSPATAIATSQASRHTASRGTSHEPDSRQLENTFVLEEKTIDSSYIIGSKPGPYVVDHSRSIYARLGARIAFFGIDARTERTRHQVNYPETYDIIFSRLRKELGAAASSSSPIKHLVVLLGIPIAYPRLTWLENIFSSPIMGPLKFMNKRFGFGGGFFNHFDGSVDLLDDLDDHYTARTHKKERLFLVHQLQLLASEFSVRISILGGDVHLAAVGRFYSSPKLNIPVEQDHRYMANIISSAIVNKPPPAAVANLLARRNKIHHLDHETDETLIKFFDKDPGDSNKTRGSNHVTMPSRNWAMITENHGAAAPVQNGLNGNHAPTNGHVHTDGSLNGSDHTPPPNNGHKWLHKGEENAGTKHKAADFAQHGKNTDGSLDVCIRVEIDQHDREGKTEPYGMTIPALAYDGAAGHHLPKKANPVGVVSETAARENVRI